MLVRSDAAGATHAFATACRAHRVGFSLGHPVDTRVQDAADTLNRGQAWYPAIESDGEIRDGAWVAEATDLLDMSAWPAGTRLILRKERPHPGAQLRFTDADGMRVTAFITDTAPGVIAGQLAGLELRHRQHARVEDRIREAKATGLANLPCHDFHANAAWLEIIMATTDLVAWTKLIGFTEPLRDRPLRNQHLPLPGAARGRPHHPRRPPTPATHRRHLAVGRSDHNRLAGHPRRLPLSRRPTCPTDHENTALGSPPNPATRDDLNMSHPEKTDHTGQSAAKPQPTPTGMQNRG